MKNDKEKEYPCPSCDEDKPDFRGECPVSATMKIRN